MLTEKPRSLEVCAYSMNLADVFSLTILLLLPLSGAVLIGFASKVPQLVRPIAILFSTVTLIYAAGFWLVFDSQSALLQFREDYVWTPELGMSLAFGIDGISYPMILLACLLTWVAILVSKSITQGKRAYYLLLLVLETAMLGVFMAQDWSLFYIFWEATLIPLFFLMDRWGGKKRQTASLNFVLYTMGGSVFMLISLLVAFDATGVHSFGFAAIAAGVQQLDSHLQILIFLGLMIGFGVKMPLFPLHGWLPLAHVEAPAPASILLSGILLKMGAYGLIRSVSMLPQAAIALQTLLFVLALIGILYGGLLAWRQTNLKRMIAYSSISHMGVVLLGIASLNHIGMMGATLQMVAHGLIAGALFMLIGLLYERTGLRDITAYGSLLKVTPKLAFFLMIALIAGVGLPSTAGFVAELHVLVGGFISWGWWILLLGLGVMITATYSLHTSKYLFTGSPYAGNKYIHDLNGVEFIAAASLIMGILFFGLYPSPLIDLMTASIDQIEAGFAPFLLNAR